MSEVNAQAQDQAELDESQDSGQADNEESQEQDDSDDTEDNKTGEDDSDDGEVDSESSKPENQEYIIAGRKYNNLTDALKAVNRITGDNTRLAGEIKALEEQVRDAEDKYKEALEANKAWSKYFEGKGEMPKQDLKKIVQEVFEENHAQQTQKEIKSQYGAEMEEVKGEIANISESDEELALDIQNKMLEIGNRLGKEINKISPKELYAMAKGMLEKITPEAKELIKETEKKTIAKQTARKIIGGVKNKSSVKSAEEVSPELANYLGQII